MKIFSLNRFFSQPAHRRLFGGFCSVALLSTVVSLSAGAKQSKQDLGLWQVYQQSFKRAKYVDLTHAIAPSIPVWSGFGPPTFKPTVNPKTGKSYTYKQDGFESTHYTLTTDQLGTQFSTLR